jgi:5-methyltetrahydropteroyltriglutamate--homocysteine methyltransferase
MARGNDKAAPAAAATTIPTTTATSTHPPLEMTKWFDTNYHYLVPEFTPETAFRWPASACSTKWPKRRRSATGQGRAAGPAELPVAGQSARRRRLRPPRLLDQLLPVYGQVLKTASRQQGVQWVQIDEPILGLDLPPHGATPSRTATGN